MLIKQRNTTVKKHMLFLLFQNELANLRDRKPAMLALNVSTHRLVTDLGQKTSPAFIALKEGVADLYRLWDEAFQK